MSQNKGRVTIPTNLDVVKETLDIVEEWGADAIRDCDGTEFPAELKDTGAKIYATYYTTRKGMGKGKSDEIQQMYIMSSFHTATDETWITYGPSLQDMLKVNTRDDITRWWEVVTIHRGREIVRQTSGLMTKSGNVVITAKSFSTNIPSASGIYHVGPVHM
ncbi:MAG: 1,3-beta-galactosyl-N-acetylhexosamine phosphorylase N-terminal domain-containing protein [Clostridia bacterium]